MTIFQFPDAQEKPSQAKKRQNSDLGDVFLPTLSSCLACYLCA
jgi:hypothetical protein